MTAHQELHLPRISLIDEQDSIPSGHSLPQPRIHHRNWNGTEAGGKVDGMGYIIDRHAKINSTHFFH